MSSVTVHPLPGAGIDPMKMPGHWTLARLGKRVLRPGGMQLTRQMLQALAIGPKDDVVEFAPGMGRTGQLVLRAHPASYTAVERDAAAADLVRDWLGQASATRGIITGKAEATGLDGCCATVVYGEAMLTMQSQSRQQAIINEAFRLLRPGGRYGIHELASTLQADQVAQAEQVRRTLVDAIHHQANPIRIAEWQAMMENAGFVVEHQFTSPLLLLEPWRIIKDEGLFGALRFMIAMFRHRPERMRVGMMKQVFRVVRPHLTAVSLVMRKPAA